MKTIKIDNTLPAPDKTRLTFNKINTIGYRLELDKSKTQTINFHGPEKDVVYHLGYLQYLSVAWESHFAVVLRPNDIWQMILMELTSVIAKNPSEFEFLFTKTPGQKQEIIVLTNNVETIDPDLVIGILKTIVPSNIGLFLPDFSTTTKQSKLAMYVAFCDLVSPYYSYGTMLCGIPEICVEGTIDDWNLIASNLNEMTKLFKNKKIIRYLEQCHQTVEMLIKTLTLPSVDSTSFFKKMVKLDPCGSGHQYKMNGWITSFLYIYDGSSLQLEGLPPHVGKMDYKNVETRREFTLYSGLFYSVVEDNYLIPQYDSFYIEKIKTPTKSNDSLDAIKLTIVSEKLNPTAHKIKGIIEVGPSKNDPIIFANYIPRHKKH